MFLSNHVLSPPLACRYNPLHPRLLEGRHNARCKAFKYNNLDPNSGDYEQIADKRSELLSDMLGKVGTGTCIETPFYPDYGCNVSIGVNCFMNFGSVFEVVYGLVTRFTVD